MTDWSLNPSVRKLLSRLPLPLSLPTPLPRAEGATCERELEGARAVLTSLQDELDLGLALAFVTAGAAVTIVDPHPLAGLLHGLPGAHMPWSSDVAGGLLAAIRASGAHEDRRTVVLIHRVRAGTDGDAAVNDGSDRLFAVGHAAAHLLRNSRMLLVLGEDLLRAGDRGALLAATAAGFCRSAHKELGRMGSTAHVLRQDGAEPATLAHAAVFLAGPRASFLTGLDLRLGAAVGPVGAKMRGKVALVTGAARGIGAAIARRLAAEGAHVWINDLAAAESAALETLAHIRKAGGTADFLPADVATVQGAAVIAATLGQQHGGVDIVVHNAGITRDRTLRKMSLAWWRLVLQVDFGAMVTVQGALDPLLREGGAIVLLSSVTGVAGNFGQANYTAAKAAVIALGQQWARAGVARGVRANVVAPGFILTDMTSQVPLLNREMAKQLTALLQPGLPGDVAELVCFLAGSGAVGLNGELVRCDGGMALGK